MKLAERLLSEFSSPSDEEIDQRDFDPSGGVRAMKIKSKDFGYIEEVVNDESIKSERLLKIYTQIDQKRTRKWKQLNPLQAEKQSLRMLKHLIARNLTHS